jgi:hypothetical protein
VIQLQVLMGQQVQTQQAHYLMEAVAQLLPITIVIIIIRSSTSTSRLSLDQDLVHTTPGT